MTCRLSGRLAIATLLLTASVSLAQPAPSVDEIVARANHAAYYQGQDGKARVTMTITDGQGRTRERELTILRRNVGDPDTEQRFYVYFHRPADVRGMTFMVWKHLDQDDDRWLYLPALDVIRRIVASDERTSFVGSHFFYEDVSGRGIHEDVHKLVETTDAYYVLESTPKDPDLAEFDSFATWVHKVSYVPVKTEYTKNGRVYRVVEALEVETIDGFPTVVRASVRDLESGGETVVEYSRVEYDIDLPENIFTERYLRRAPTRYVR